MQHNTLFSDWQQSGGARHYGALQRAERGTFSDEGTAQAGPVTGALWHQCNAVSDEGMAENAAYSITLACRWISAEDEGAGQKAMPTGSVGCRFVSAQDEGVMLPLPTAGMACLHLTQDEGAGQNTVPTGSIGCLFVSAQDEGTGDNVAYSVVGCRWISA